ncbi:zf-HC2 domain-containing protein, partial [Kitasatospora sp. NPDC093558]|uniref:zf-HC2 domain-containing protein n=1 Tax=Kitasatospora sp. NPDC093558 TaxID=3155201 RepID=UPI003425EBD7
MRPAEPAAEEHHLGERLSAFLDGELGHDSRERVQAHLATCPQCLAEADEGRSVKHLLTRTGTPGPSSALMARLMAVGSLPDDEQPGADWRDGRDDDDLPGGGVTGPGTLGGSRLDGGSFGRGAGASFGAGALGAGTPLPGVDPRAFGRGGGRPAPADGPPHPAPRGSG